MMLNFTMWLKFLLLFTSLYAYITCPIVILTGVTEGNSDIYQDGKIKRAGTKTEMTEKRGKEREKESTMLVKAMGDLIKKC